MAAALGFVLTSSESKLVTTAAKYHPQVLNIHRKLHKAAHHHLTTVHHHFNKAHWPHAPNVSKLRGSASHFIHLGHLNHRHANHEEHLKSLNGKDSKPQVENMMEQAATQNVNDSGAKQTPQQMTEAVNDKTNVKEEPPALE